MSLSRLRLIPLEDRCTPASFVGNIITLDDAGEVLTISTDTSGQYTLTSSVDVNDSTEPVVFTPTGPVSIVDTVGSASVLFANSTAAYAHNFTVELNDGSQGVRFDGATAFGVNSLSVTVDRDIAVNPLAKVTTTSGAIDFVANLQPAARIGEFIGVDVQGQVTATGTGTVTINGRGGLLNIYGMFGVQVLGAGASIMSVDGKLTVTGQGGGGSGDANVGVHVAGGAKITAGIGGLTVTGTGGAGAGQGNYGVLVQNTGSGITSDGGNVTVNGTAGVNGSKSYGVGVFVINGGKISTGTVGAVTVAGIGGGTGTSAYNSGVFVVGSGSTITSSGGAVSVAGTGGGGSVGGSTGVHVADGGRVTGEVGTTVTGIGGAGTGSHNFGVLIQLSDALITSGGNTAVSGTGGANTSSYGAGVFIFLGGQITTTGDSQVQVTGAGYGNTFSHGIVLLDSGSAITGTGTVNLAGTANVTGFGIVSPTDIFIAGRGMVSGGRVNIQTNGLAIAGDGGTGMPNIAGSVTTSTTGTVTIQPGTPAGRIGVGTGIDDFFNPALTVSNDSLGQITGGNLVIGRNGGGTVQIAGINNLTNVQNVQFLTDGDITFVRNSRIFAPSTNITLSAFGFIIPPGNNSDVKLFNSPLVTLATGSKVQIQMNGLLPDQYGHLDSTGAINLNSATLQFTGSYSPTTGQVFTLVTAISITGTFRDLPDNTIVVFNGVSLRINYTATSVTATVV